METHIESKTSLMEYGRKCQVVKKRGLMHLTEMVFARSGGGMVVYV
jgi:hypothetical protein